MVSTSRKKSSVLKKFFWNEEYASTSRDEELLENIWGNEGKWLPLARKQVSTCKNKVCL